MVRCLAPVLPRAWPGAAPKVNPLIEDLKWMAGSWVGRAFGGRMEEHWTAPAGGTMFGLNRVVSDGETTSREWISIETVDGGLAMRVRPGGFEGTRTVAFELSKTEGTRAEFERPDNDFPARIVYARAGDALRIELIPRSDSTRTPITIELAKGDLASHP
ncbi:MAG: hypothetical protein KIS66_00055 [Fimbriimonadaceae bacterium]|nr:hypothetical protein [Fimbriimonadaceae bacterium]